MMTSNSNEQEKKPGIAAPIPSRALEAKQAREAITAKITSIKNKTDRKVINNSILEKHGINRILRLTAIARKIARNKKLSHDEQVTALLKANKNCKKAPIKKSITLNKHFFESQDTQSLFYGGKLVWQVSRDESGIHIIAADDSDIEITIEQGFEVNELKIESLGKVKLSTEHKSLKQLDITARDLDLNFADNSLESLDLLIENNCDIHGIIRKANKADIKSHKLQWHDKATIDDLMLSCDHFTLSDHIKTNNHFKIDETQNLTLEKDSVIEANGQLDIDVDVINADGNIIAENAKLTYKEFNTNGINVFWRSHELNAETANFGKDAILAINPGEHSINANLKFNGLLYASPFTVSQGVISHASAQRSTDSDDLSELFTYPTLQKQSSTDFSIAQPKLSIQSKEYCELSGELFFNGTNCELESDDSITLSGDCYFNNAIILADAKNKLDSSPDFSFTSKRNKTDTNEQLAHSLLADTVILKGRVESDYAIKINGHEHTETSDLNYEASQNLYLEGKSVHINKNTVMTLQESDLILKAEGALIIDIDDESKNNNQNKQPKFNIRNGAFTSESLAMNATVDATNALQCETESSQYIRGSINAPNGIHFIGEKTYGICNLNAKVIKFNSYLNAMCGIFKTNCITNATVVDIPLPCLTLPYSDETTSSLSNDFWGFLANLGKRIAPILAAFLLPSSIGKMAAQSLLMLYQVYCSYKTLSAYMQQLEQVTAKLKHRNNQSTKSLDTELYSTSIALINSGISSLFSLYQSYISFNVDMPQLSVSSLVNSAWSTIVTNNSSSLITLSAFPTPGCRTNTIFYFPIGLRIFQSATSAYSYTPFSSAYNVFCNLSSIFASHGKQHEHSIKIGIAHDVTVRITELTGSCPTYVYFPHVGSDTALFSGDQASLSHFLHEHPHVKRIILMSDQKLSLPNFNREHQDVEIIAPEIEFRYVYFHSGNLTLSATKGNIHNLASDIHANGVANLSAIGEYVTDTVGVRRGATIHVQEDHGKAASHKTVSHNLADHHYVSDQAQQLIAYHLDHMRIDNHHPVDFLRAALQATATIIINADGVESHASIFKAPVITMHLLNTFDDHVVDHQWTEKHHHFKLLKAEHIKDEAKHTQAAQTEMTGKISIDAGNDINTEATQFVTNQAVNLHAGTVNLQPFGATEEHKRTAHGIGYYHGSDTKDITQHPTVIYNNGTTDKPAHASIVGEKQLINHGARIIGYGTLTTEAKEVIQVQLENYHYEHEVYWRLSASIAGVELFQKSYHLGPAAKQAALNAAVGRTLEQAAGNAISTLRPSVSISKHESTIEQTTPGNGGISQSSVEIKAGKLNDDASYPVVTDKLVNNADEVTETNHTFTTTFSQKCQSISTAGADLNYADSNTTTIIQDNPQAEKPAELNPQRSYENTISTTTKSHSAGASATSFHIGKSDSTSTQETAVKIDADGNSRITKKQTMSQSGYSVSIAKGLIQDRLFDRIVNGNSAKFVSSGFIGGIGTSSNKESNEWIISQSVNGKPIIESHTTHQSKHHSYIPIINPSETSKLFSPISNTASLPQETGEMNDDPLGELAEPGLDYSDPNLVEKLLDAGLDKFSFSDSTDLNNSNSTTNATDSPSKTLSDFKKRTIGNDETKYIPGGLITGKSLQDIADAINHQDYREKAKACARGLVKGVGLGLRDIGNTILDPWHTTLLPMIRLINAFAYSVSPTATVAAQQAARHELWQYLHDFMQGVDYVIKAPLEKELEVGARILTGWEVPGKGLKAFSKTSKLPSGIAEAAAKAHETAPLQEAKHSHTATHSPNVADIPPPHSLGEGFLSIDRDGILNQAGEQTYYFVQNNDGRFTIGKSNHAVPKELWQPFITGNTPGDILASREYLVDALLMRHECQNIPELKHIVYNPKAPNQDTLLAIMAGAKVKPAALKTLRSLLSHSSEKRLHIVSEKTKAIDTLFAYFDEHPELLTKLRTTQPKVAFLDKFDTEWFEGNLTPNKIDGTGIPRYIVKRDAWEALVAEAKPSKNPIELNETLPGTLAMRAAQRIALKLQEGQPKQHPFNEEALRLLTDESDITKEEQLILDRLNNPPNKETELFRDFLDRHLALISGITYSDGELCIHFNSAKYKQWKDADGLFTIQNNTHLLNNDQPAQLAGRLIFSDGKLTRIDNRSATYPSNGFKVKQNIISSLEKSGISTAQAEYTAYVDNIPMEISLVSQAANTPWFTDIDSNKITRLVQGSFLFSQHDNADPTSLLSLFCDDAYGATQPSDTSTSYASQLLTELQPYFRASYLGVLDALHDIKETFEHPIDTVLLPLATQYCLYEKLLSFTSTLEEKTQIIGMIVDQQKIILEKTNEFIHEPTIEKVRDFSSLLTSCALTDGVFRLGRLAKLGGTLSKLPEITLQPHAAPLSKEFINRAITTHSGDGKLLFITQTDGSATLAPKRVTLPDGFWKPHVRPPGFENDLLQKDLFISVVRAWREIQSTHELSALKAGRLKNGEARFGRKTCMAMNDLVKANKADAFNTLVHDNPGLADLLETHDDLKRRLGKQAADQLSNTLTMKVDHATLSQGKKIRAFGKVTLDKGEVTRITHNIHPKLKSNKTRVMQDTKTSLSKTDLSISRDVVEKIKIREAEKAVDRVSKPMAWEGLMGAGFLASDTDNIQDEHFLEHLAKHTWAHLKQAYELNYHDYERDLRYLIIKQINLIATLTPGALNDDLKALKLLLESITTTSQENETHLLKHGMPKKIPRQLYFRNQLQSLSKHLKSVDTELNLVPRWFLKNAMQQYHQTFTGLTGLGENYQKMAKGWRLYLNEVTSIIDRSIATVNKFHKGLMVTATLSNGYLILTAKNPIKEAADQACMLTFAAASARAGLAAAPACGEFALICAIALPPIAAVIGAEAMEKPCRTSSALVAEAFEGDEPRRTAFQFFSPAKDDQVNMTYIKSLAQHF